MNRYSVGSSIVPSVAPGEQFTTNLGIDTSLQVVAHALKQNSAQSGIVNKTKTVAISQRYTIKNTSKHAVPRLLIYNQFPIAQDSSISVKHLSPALPHPSECDLDSASSYVRENGIKCKWAASGNDEVENSQGANEGKVSLSSSTFRV